jgi:hypothetical protein
MQRNRRRRKCGLHRDTPVTPLSRPAYVRGSIAWIKQDRNSRILNTTLAAAHVLRSQRALVCFMKNANLQRKLSLFMRALGTDGLNFPAFERLKLVDDFLDVLRAVKRVLLSTSADGC